MPIVFFPYRCMRYMPTFCGPPSGSLVNTSGSVTNGPPSSGHVVSTGSFVRSTSVSTTSCTGALTATFFGIANAAEPSEKSFATFPSSELGTFGRTALRTRRATSSIVRAPKAIAMRFSVPNWFVSTGNCEPATLVKRSAGPPALTTRSLISEISR